MQLFITTIILQQRIRKEWFLPEIRPYPSNMQNLTEIDQLVSIVYLYNYIGTNIYGNQWR